MKPVLAAFILFLGVAGLTVAASSCSSPNGDAAAGCVPGRTLACTCKGGGQGLKNCAADGSVFEACEFCKEPANIGVEAGFKDVAAELGLDEGIGPCVGFDDFDNDGDQDMIMSKMNDNPGAGAPGQVVIYENLGAGHFSPKPVAKLLDGMTILCIAADFDRDGLDDVVIKSDPTSEKPALSYFRNLGKFAFENQASGFDFVPLDDHMILGLGTFDYDNDGWLDLVIGRSHGGGPSSSDACKMKENDFVCEVAPYAGTSGPVVYRNDQGKFKLTPFLLNGPFPGTTNTLAFADLDGNGLPDVVMANDWYSNHVHLQETPGKFKRAESVIGMALFNHGMGLAVADFDNDGFADVYGADLGPNNLWFGSAKGVFTNLNKETGVSATTRYHSNWAAIAEDFNLNGFADIYVASSGVVTNEEDMIKMAMVSSSPINELIPQFDILFWNHGGREFSPITLPHRGQQQPTVIFASSATADYDGDGDMDILASTGDGLQVRLLQNQQPPGDFIEVELIGKKSNPHGIGAVVELIKSGVAIQRRFVGTGGCIGNSWHLAHFGLGTAGPVDGIRVRWPGGHQQVVSNVTSNQVLKIQED